MASMQVLSSAEQELPVYSHRCTLGELRLDCSAAGARRSNIVHPELATAQLTDAFAAACALGAGTGCLPDDAARSTAFTTAPRLPILHTQRSAGSQVLRNLFASTSRATAPAAPACERGRAGFALPEARGRSAVQPATGKWLYVPEADFRSARLDSPSPCRSSRAPSPAESLRTRPSRSPSPTSSFVPPSSLGRHRYSPPLSSTSSFASSSYFSPLPSTASTAPSSAGTCSRNTSPSSLHSRRSRPGLARGSSVAPSVADVFYVIEEEATAPPLEMSCRSGGSRGGRGAVFLLPPYEAGVENLSPPAEEEERGGAARKGLRKLKGLVMPYSGIR